MLCPVFARLTSPTSPSICSQHQPVQASIAPNTLVSITVQPTLAGADCRALIALLSPKWIESPWCTAEVNHAQALRKSIIPLRIAAIDETAFDRSAPPAIRRLQFIDWRDPDARERLRDALMRAGLDRLNPSVWQGDRDPY